MLVFSSYFKTNIVFQKLFDMDAEKLLLLSRLCIIFQELEGLSIVIACCHDIDCLG